MLRCAADPISVMAEIAVESSPTVVGSNSRAAITQYSRPTPDETPELSTSAIPSRFWGERHPSVAFRGAAGAALRAAGPQTSVGNGTRRGGAREHDGGEQRGDAPPATTAAIGTAEPSPPIASSGDDQDAAGEHARARAPRTPSRPRRRARRRARWRWPRPARGWPPRRTAGPARRAAPSEPGDHHASSSTAPRRWTRPARPPAAAGPGTVAPGGRSSKPSTTMPAALSANSRLNCGRATGRRGPAARTTTPRCSRTATRRRRRRSARSRRTPGRGPGPRTRGRSAAGRRGVAGRRAGSRGWPARSPPPSTTLITASRTNIGRQLPVQASSSPPSTGATIGATLDSVMNSENSRAAATPLAMSAATALASTMPPPPESPCTNRQRSAARRRGERAQHRRHRAHHASSRAAAAAGPTRPTAGRAPAARRRCRPRRR